MVVIKKSVFEQCERCIKQKESGVYKGVAGCCVHSFLYSSSTS